MYQIVSSRRFRDESGRRSYFSLYFFSSYNHLYDGFSMNGERTPYQVLVIPFRQRGDDTEYALLRRSDVGYWQWIAGGGEAGEIVLESARREVYEEAGVSRSSPFYRLQATFSVPTSYFAARDRWPRDLYVIPEYCFAVDVQETTINLSHEHTEFRWLDFESASKMLHWQTNQVALWELSQRIALSDMVEER